MVTPLEWVVARNKDVVSMEYGLPNYYYCIGDGISQALAI